MIRLDVDSVYECARFRSGASDRGRWEVVVVVDKDAKGKNKQEITIFPATVPSNVKEGGQFIVKRILSVARKKAKDWQGNWTLVDVRVTADIEPMKDELNLDGDLPFTFGAYDDDDNDEPLTIKDLLGSDTPTDLL